MRTALTLLTAAIFLTLLSAPPSADSQQAPKKSMPRFDHYGDPLPDHALLRIGTTRLRPGGIVTNMVFTADGKHLVTVNGTSGGNTWDVATGKCLCNFGPPAKSVRKASPIYSRVISPACGLSADGSLAALLDADGICRVYDTSTGKSKCEFKPLEKDIQCLCISPDNQRLASLDKDGLAHVYDITSDQSVLSSRIRIDGAKGFSHIAFSDSKSLATLSVEKIVQIWDTANGKHVRTLRDDEKSGCEWFVIAPTGKIFLTGSEFDGGTLFVRDMSTGAKRQQLFHHGLNVGPRLAAVVFSQDASTVVVSNFNRSNDCEVQIWDLEKAKSQPPHAGGRSLDCHHTGAQRVAVSPNGKILATGDCDGMIRFWDTASGNRILRFEGYNEPGISVGFTSDGKELISQGWVVEKFWGGMQREETWRCWDATIGTHLRNAWTNARTAILSGDGRSSVSTGTDNTIYVEDTSGLRFNGKGTKLPDSWRSLTPWFLNDDGSVLVGRTDSRLNKPGPVTVETVSTTSGRGIFSHKSEHSLADMHERYVVFHSDIPDGHRFTFWDFHADRTVSRQLLWQYTPTLAATIAGLADSPFGQAALLPRPQWFRGEYYFYSTGDMSLSPNGLLISPLSRSSTGFSTRSGGYVALPVWDMLSCRQVIALSVIDDSITCMTFSPDNLIVAAGARSGRVYLWNLASDKPVGNLIGHTAGVFSIDFSPDGKQLVTGSDDTTILLWDVSQWTDKSRTYVPLGKEAAELWNSLADAASPFPTFNRYMQSPKEIVAFLRDKVHPQPMDDIRRHITALGSSKFTEREQASTALQELGMQAQPSLQKVLQGKPNLETRRRVELLLSKLEYQPMTGEALQAQRALDILEILATPDALELLDSLSRCDPDAWLTQEASWALKRARKRVG